MINSDKVEIIQEKPYCIFKVENFLEKIFYEELSENFPRLDKNIAFDAKYGKFGLKMERTPSNNFGKAILKNKILNKLHNLINSRYFFEFIKKNFYWKCANSQNNFLRKIRYLRPLKLSNSKPSFFDFLFSKVNSTYHYSWVLNNGKLAPHVDAQRKYLSMLLYFPQSGDAEYGTSFWHYNHPSYSNKHLTEENEVNNFKNKRKLILKCPFVGNTLFGFIRNDFSWHSVEPINVSDSYIRRNIVINFMYNN